MDDNILDVLTNINSDLKGHWQDDALRPDWKEDSHSLDQEGNITKLNTEQDYMVHPGLADFDSIYISPDPTSSDIPDYHEVLSSISIIPEEYKPLTTDDRSLKPLHDNPKTEGKSAGQRSFELTKREADKRATQTDISDAITQSIRDEMVQEKITDDGASTPDDRSKVLSPLLERYTEQYYSSREEAIEAAHDAKMEMKYMDEIMQNASILTMLNPVWVIAASWVESRYRHQYAMARADLSENLTDRIMWHATSSGHAAEALANTSIEIATALSPTSSASKYSSAFAIARTVKKNKALELAIRRSYNAIVKRLGKTPYEITYGNTFPKKLRWLTIEIKPFRALNNDMKGSFMHRHHTILKTIFEKGPQNTKGLGDYVPAIVLEEREHLSAVHAALNQHLRRFLNKKQLNSKEVGQAIDECGKFYDKMGKARGVEYSPYFEALSYAIKEFKKTIYNSVK